MRIGIITLCWHGNYGNRLQNYALQKFLNEKLKIKDVQSIWFEKDNYLPEKLFKWNIKLFIKYIINWKNTRKAIEFDYVRKCIKEYNIKKFSDRYINIRYDFNIEKLNSEYDYFIVGSDQVWNPYFKNYIEEKFLRFADKNKRVSYAASLGVSKMPEDTKCINMFKRYLKDFSCISVREKEGAGIIRDLINEDVQVMVDPTILLSKEEWLNIAKRPEWYKDEKYIFTYFLGEIPNLLEQISKKYNLTIYNLMDRNNLDLYTSEVEHFIFLIKNATLVCTDSFHGTVFSILMNTPFLVVNRNQKGVVDMSSRIKTLLDLFNLKNRYIDNIKDIDDIDSILNMDFSKVRNIQKIEQDRACKYIKNALHLK